MAYIPILASEYDTDSPGSTTLFGKIAGNIAYLYNILVTVGVHRANLYTTTAQVDRTTPGNFDFDNAGQYGFYPQFKVGNAANSYSISVASDNNVVYQTKPYLVGVSGGDTVSGIMRYVRASRWEPTLWLHRNKLTGGYISGAYWPETMGKTSPISPVNWETEEVIVIPLRHCADGVTLDRELNRKDGPWINDPLLAFRLGLLLGRIHLVPESAPPVTEEYCPALYVPGLKLATIKISGGRDAD